MRKILTIVTFLIAIQARAQQWVYVGNDTAKVVFLVSSNRYEYSRQVTKQGFIVRMVFHYVGDRMPCADESDCDYKDKHKVIAYLDRRKKEFDEKSWHVWDSEIIHK